MGALKHEQRYSQNRPPVVTSAKNKSLKNTDNRYNIKLLKIGPNSPRSSLPNKFYNNRSLSLLGEKRHNSHSLLKRPCTRVESKPHINDTRKFVDEVMPVSEHIKNRAENLSGNPSVKSQFPALCQAYGSLGKHDFKNTPGVGFFIQKQILGGNNFNNESNLAQIPPNLHDDLTSYYSKNKKKVAVEEVSRRRQEFERVSLLSSSSQPILSLPKLPSDFNEIIGEAFKGKIALTLTPQDISTLAPRSWLNDEVINHTLNLVLKRSQSAGNTEYPKIHVFNTFFYSFLKSGGYARVKKWTRKIDLFSLDLVLIPVHLGNHWCMAGIDFRSKRILYFDSMLGSGESASDLLLNYVAQEHLQKKGTQLNCSEWKKYIPNDIPVQENCHDCGVFAIMFGRCLASPHFPIHEIPKKFPFSQADMPNLRQQIAYEIITDQLLF